MTIRIPVDETEEAVLKILPSLKKFEKISIENISHLAIIKNLHHPQLRHLIVYTKDSHFNHQGALILIRESLDNFTDIISLKIDIPHFYDITQLEDRPWTAELHDAARSLMV
jgi:hypothetical protein